MAKKSPAAVDPFKLFQEAWSYSFSSRVLGTHSAMRMRQADESGQPNSRSNPLVLPCATPSVVLSAFSLELYLKCLTTLTTGGPHKHVHTLQELYDELPTEIQADIREFYTDCFSPSQSGKWCCLAPVNMNGVPLPPNYYEFEPTLARISTSFNDWRYHFEGSGKQLHFSASDRMTHAVQKAIFKLKPEWERVLDRNPPLPLMAEPSPHS